MRHLSSVLEKAEPATHQAIVESKAAEMEYQRTYPVAEITSEARDQETGEVRMVVANTGTGTVTTTTTAVNPETNERFTTASVVHHRVDPQRNKAGRPNEDRRFPSDWTVTMAKRALNKIRAELIRESTHNANMLWPARKLHYRGKKDGVVYETTVRDPVWDWARVRAIGDGDDGDSDDADVADVDAGGDNGKQEEAPETRHLRKRFFHVNRWPVHLQTPSTQRKIREGMKEDGPHQKQPATDKEIRAAMVPYHERYGGRTEFLRGATTYPWGDTKLQRKYLRSRLERGLQERKCPTTHDLMRYPEDVQPVLMMNLRIRIDGATELDRPSARPTVRRAPLLAPAFA